jgi:hypothetical protein
MIRSSTTSQVEQAPLRARLLNRHQLREIVQEIPDWVRRDYFERELNEP